MSEKLEAVVNSVAELSVLELSELIKMLEDKFGVEASAGAPMMMGAMPAMGGAPAGGGEAAAEEAPTEFDVILSDAGGQKIQVIKEVRAITGLGLKEAKALVDEAPKPIKENASEDEAKEIKEKLEGVGATVELKGK
jgi:large subunit ribosomal protein L7/L12